MLLIDNADSRRAVLTGLTECPEAIPGGLVQRLKGRITAKRLLNAYRDPETFYLLDADSLTNSVMLAFLDGLNE